MLKKAAKKAVWVAFGAAIVGGVLPRILFRDFYGETWPPVWKEGLLYFVMGFIAAFSVLIFRYRAKEKQDKGKAAICRESAPIFQSRLPANIDWEQVNAFLRATKFRKQLLWDTWRESDAFAAYPVSDTTVACLGCLHEDLLHCGTFAFDENGKEDRHEEYRLLRENLYSKYAGIDADILEGIYLYYLQEDR